MSNAKLTMDQVLEEVGLTAKWEAIGEAWGKREVARNALNEGSSVDFIQRITGLPLETINKLAAEGKFEVSRNGYRIKTLSDITELSLETIKKLVSDGEMERQDTGINTSHYFEAIFKANTAVLRETLMMGGDTAQAINEILENDGFAAKWVARGFARGKSEVTRNALNEGSSVDFIQ
ncbi:hypothetical protein FACS1894109_16820 [Spirochaetia bacterium]|nr:hypothetical protein FACS1894109_16820 [Spirochaetia bacterium]